MNVLEDICKITEQKMNAWKDSYGYAPNDVASKLERAMLNWIIELTDCLHIWYDKGLNLTEGELILARANLGTLVEGWLKFFYTVHYDDYKNSPLLTKKGKVIEPENIKLENLKKFSIDILWPKDSDMYKWVDSVQNKRNAIHSFKFRDIGDVADFITDVDLYYDFIKKIISRIPDNPDSLY